MIAKENQSKGVAIKRPIILKTFFQGAKQTLLLKR